MVGFQGTNWWCDGSWTQEATGYSDAHLLLLLARAVNLRHTCGFPCQFFNGVLVDNLYSDYILLVIIDRHISQYTE